MFARSNRLSTDKDVTRVLRKGRAVFTNLVGVKALPNPEGKVRITVVVSTKVHKRATERNLIKRRVREALHKLIPSFKKPVDMVVTAQNEAVGRSFADLKAALEYCLGKLGLL